MTRLACAVLALVAVVALAIVQTNIPWADQNSNGSHTTARTWDRTSDNNFFGFSSHDSKGWYDSGWSDQDKNAVNQLQLAAPLVLAGAVLLLVGSLLAFTAPGTAGAIVSLVGGLCAAGGTLLYFLAIQDLFNNSQTWQGGFYLGVAGAVLGVAGGVIGLAAGNRRGYAT
jgi:hypothetical protein